MRYAVIICAAVAISLSGHTQKHRTDAPIPNQFEIGIHTFFDSGAQHFYELLVVRPGNRGSFVERILLTPEGYSCMSPAKLERATGTLSQAPSDLLRSANPCAIPEKDMRNESKRSKHRLVFSYANIFLRVQCDAQPRIISADVFDEDWFLVHPDTPKNTSHVMALEDQLEKAVGPGVMDKPAFPIPQGEQTLTSAEDSEALRDIAAGTYDSLFPAPLDTLSDLYRASLILPPAPKIELKISEPFSPLEFIQPVYPLIARAARVEGIVKVIFEVDADGSTKELDIYEGPQMLRVAVQDAVRKWKFQKDAANQTIHATIEFHANCNPPENVK
jgi:TonB family protein